MTLFSIGGPLNVKDPTIQKCLDRAKFYDDQAPSIRVWHQNGMAEHVGRGPRVGFPFFELDPLQSHEVHHLNRLDLLLVTSEWGREVARRSGVKVPISVVPLGVDRTIFHEKVPSNRLYADQTVFFNVGKWEVRKGHDVLLSAFCKAFRPSDKVMLRMLCNNPFIGDGNQVWSSKFKGSEMGKRIEIVERAKTQGGVARFMAEGDVGVFPARAEGWNLDLLEALSMGKHVITTDYSAHTEYVSTDNAYLVESKGLVDAQDGVWFHGQGRWCEPDEDQLIHSMRTLHVLRQSGGLGVNTGGIETAKKFSWEKSAQRLIDSLP